MEAQLEAFQANAAGSFVAPMIITPSGSIAGNGTKAQLAGQTTIGPGIGVLPQGPSAFAFDATSDVIQSSGGSQVFLPIHVVDLPSPPVLPAPLPNPFPSPIDIGQVPPTVILGPLAPPESTASPIVAGEPSKSVSPLGVPSKLGVEGNRGKSQLMDVASSQVPQNAVGLPSAPSMVEEASSTGRDGRAMPATSGADALARETAGDDESSGGAESMVAFRPADAKTATDYPVEDASAAASDSRSLDRPVVVAVAANTVAVPATAPVSDLAVAASPAVLKVKAEANAGMPIAAADYCRADMVGMAILAFAGQHLVERWRYPAPGQPRPIVMRRKKQVEQDWR
jgi:hypothetical protein